MATTNIPLLQDGINFIITDNFGVGEQKTRIAGKLSSTTNPYVDLAYNESASKLVNAVEIDWNEGQINYNNNTHSVETTGKLFSIIQDIGQKAYTNSSVSISNLGLYAGSGTELANTESSTPSLIFGVRLGSTEYKSSTVQIDGVNGITVTSGTDYANINIGQIKISGSNLDSRITALEKGLQSLSNELNEYIGITLSQVYIQSADVSYDVSGSSVIDVAYNNYSSEIEALAGLGVNFVGLMSNGTIKSITSPASGGTLYVAYMLDNNGEPDGKGDYDDWYCKTGKYHLYGVADFGVNANNTPITETANYLVINVYVPSTSD